VYRAEPGSPACHAARYAPRGTPGQSQRIGHLLDIGQLTNQVILLSRE